MRGLWGLHAVMLFALDYLLTRICLLVSLKPGARLNQARICGWYIFQWCAVLCTRVTSILFSHPLPMQFQVANLNWLFMHTGTAH